MSILATGGFDKREACPTGSDKREACATSPNSNCISMLVSWNWLKQYVTLDMPHEELERRLML
ncbi:MAG: hypothetical protein ACOCWL_04020, partial [Thermoguttaceae bacterium]